MKTDFEKYSRLAAAFRTAGEMAQERGLNCRGAHFVLCTILKQTLPDDVPSSFIRAIAKIGIEGFPNFAAEFLREARSWDELAATYAPQTEAL